MTTTEMMVMRVNGATYQEIADACGLSKQDVHKRIVRYTKRLTSGVRGHGFCLLDIKYKSIAEHFDGHARESISSFANAVGVPAGVMKNFLTGKADSHFTISKIRRMCEIVGKPFEEVFAEDFVKDGADNE